MKGKLISCPQKLKFVRQGSSNSGAAMVSVVFVTLILLVIVVALVNMTLTEIKIAYNDQYAAQALYLAEAGVELGIDYLYKQPNFRGELLNLTSFQRPFDFGQGQINSVTIQNSNGKIKIIGEGEVEGVKRKMSITLAVVVLEDEENYEIIINRESWNYEF